MAAGAAVTSIIGQNQNRQAAKGAEEAKRVAQEDLMIENRKRATTDYLRQVRLETLQQEQEKSSVNEKSMDIHRQAEATIGTTIASAAERGVAGRSVDMIVDDFHAQENLEIGRLRINQAQRNAQHGDDTRAYAEQFEQRISQQKDYIPKAQNPVDYFGPIFGVGTQTLSAANSSGAFKDKATAKPTAPVQSVPYYNED